MQGDLIDAYYVCIKKKQLVERVAKKVSIQILTLTCKIDIDIVNSGL